MAGRRLDACALRRWAHTSVGDLITHTNEINRLNVFPVADADTGTNMLFTMRAAWEQVDAQGPGDVAAVSAALAEGALHGARGNSGVILSQIVRGLAVVTAEAAAERGGELPEVDGELYAATLRQAAAFAATSMGESVPGTIVTVLQAAADAATGVASDGADAAHVAAVAADAAADALDRTPQQLAVLASAGVVDAGGRGLLVLLDAMTSTLTGESTRRAEYVPSPSPSPSPGAHSGGERNATAAPPQFEVMYLLSDCGADDVERLRGRLDHLGESVAIAASGGGQYSVHVHADDAGAAVEAGLAVGTPSR
ncbi:DAK2 domain-containing protein, partial [Mycolicibacterium arseniciresistens]